MPRKKTVRKRTAKNKESFIVVTKDDEEEYGSACDYVIFPSQQAAEDAAKEEAYEKGEQNKQYLICKVVATSQPPLPKDLNFTPV